MESSLEFLKSELAEVRFAAKGQMGEVSNAIEPVLQAFENANSALLPKRIARQFKNQLEHELKMLDSAHLKRVIRITDAQFLSSQNKNALGFMNTTDASCQWREAVISAAVLEQYIDTVSGECLIESYDENATITLRQSRHIKASDRVKAKQSKADIYTREHYNCPSCGAELNHIADSTSCPYCGAFITFNFYDWQLDSFYIDMHKESILTNVKEAAKTSVSIFAGLLSGLATVFSWVFDRSEANTRTRQKTGMSFNSYLGGIITVALLILIIVFVAFLAMPWYVRAALGAVVLAAIGFGVVKALKRTEQGRKKKRIVRYSDAYLRSCVYAEVWKKVDTTNLIDFSLDEVVLRSVANTETETTITVGATVIKKYLENEAKIAVVTDEAELVLRRARYPERKRSKGKIMQEKECPACGAPFESDERGCCSYCGYGLKLENYIWRRIG